MNFSLPRACSPTKSLLIADMIHDKMDGQIASCILQGIVNRTSDEKIYVMHTYCQDNRGNWEARERYRLNKDENRSYNPFDFQVQMASTWLSEIYCDLPKSTLSTSEDTDYPMTLSLIERFSSYVKGLIIFDPYLPDATIEAGTTIAGQTDGIVVSPWLAERLSAYNFPIIEDLRNRFTGNIDCLDWLRNNYFEKANHNIAFTWSHMDLGPDSWGAANKDFVVANRLFTFYLDIHRNNELEHYPDVLRLYPEGTPIYGWTDELVADAYFSRLGYFMVPMISVENMTVHSSFEPIKLEPQNYPAPALEKDAVYVAFHIADGDNLLHSMVYEPNTILNSKAFGKVPSTWILNPVLPEIAPRVMTWLRNKLDSVGDETASMTGDGHPLSERRRGFKFYCDYCAHYMEMSGMVTMKQMVEGEAVAWNIQPKALLGGYSGIDWRGIDIGDYHKDGKTFHVGSSCLGETDIEGFIARSCGDEPVFISIYAGTGSMDVCTRIDNAAREWTEKFPNKKLRFVLSCQLADLYDQWLSSCNQ